MPYNKLLLPSLQAIISAKDRGLDYQLAQLLSFGCERFDLDIGILSKISGDAYEVMHVVCPDNLELKAGDRFNLSDTYCSMTMNTRGTVRIEHVGESSSRSHPAYEKFRLEAYIGTPVKIGENIYGTLNFSSPNPASRKFLHSDIEALQLMSVWPGTELGAQLAGS